MDAWIDSFLDGSFELLILVRVFFAILLGSILGIERELYKRPAGLRTHILVCASSCLIMLVSMYGFGDKADPSRLAAQVVSGIGFLGAGAIIRGDKDIKGITTAATIWMSAMIGLACGNGFYFGAIIVTIFALAILTVFRKIEIKMVNSSKYKSKVIMTLLYKENVMVDIREYLNEVKLLVSDIDSKIVTNDKQKVLKIAITFEKDSSISSLYEFVDKVEKNYTPLELKLSHE